MIAASDCLALLNAALTRGRETRDDTPDAIIVPQTNAWVRAIVFACDESDDMKREGSLLEVRTAWFFYKGIAIQWAGEDGGIEPFVAYRKPSRGAV